MDDYWLDG
jgi:hypothetical protein